MCFNGTQRKICLDKDLRIRLSILFASNCVENMFCGGKINEVKTERTSYKKVLAYYQEIFA